MGTARKQSKAVAELLLEVLLIRCNQTLVWVFHSAKIDGTMLLNW